MTATGLDGTMEIINTNKDEELQETGKKTPGWHYSLTRSFLRITDVKCPVWVHLCRFHKISKAFLEVVF